MRGLWYIKLCGFLSRLGLHLPGTIFYIGGSDTLPPPLSKEEEREVLAMELCRMSEERGEEGATISAKLDSLECRSEDVSVEGLQKDITTTLYARKRTVLSIRSLEVRLNQIIRALIARKSEKETVDKEFWKMWDEVILFAGSVVELKRQSESDKENGDISNQVVRNEGECDCR